MRMTEKLELRSRPKDAERAQQLFQRIEAILKEGRRVEAIVADMLREVRRMMHNEFPDLRVLKSFVIEDPVRFTAWRVDVICLDGRPIELVHDTFEPMPIDVAAIRKKYEQYPSILEFIGIQERHGNVQLLERLNAHDPAFIVEHLGPSLTEVA